MSSPIHRDEQDDLELIYAPRSMRESILAPVEHSAQATERNRSSAKFGPRFSGDRAMLDLQRQLAFDPDAIPEPLTGADAIIRPLLMRLCSVTALAAFAAWGLVSYSDVKRTTEIVPAGTSARAIAASNQEVLAMQPSPLRPSLSQTVEAPPTVDKSPSIVVAVADGAPDAPARIPVTSAPRIESPTLPPALPQRANERRVLRLDSDEIATLLKRSRDFIANGDLAAARLLLRRAAEAGSAEAALTLGTTYDPLELQRLGAVGTAPDAARARQWYQRAAELGSTAASQQLAGLGEGR